MEQYISKSALVAKIERLKSDALQKKEQCKRRGLEKIMHQIGAYNKVLSLINTLEVKEVDLENEIESSMNNLCELGCYAQSLLDNPDDYEGFANPFPKEVDDEIANFAKHFFELGIKAQKGE